VDARGEILELKNTVNGMVVRFVEYFLILSYANQKKDCGH